MGNINVLMSSRFLRLDNAYSEVQNKEAIMGSVTGPVGVVFRSVGPKASVEEVLCRLESV